MTTTPEFAAIIIDQLGGPQIFKMAFAFAAHSQVKQSVTFHVAKSLRRQTVDKITHVDVTLDRTTDTYTVGFYAMRGLYGDRVAEVAMVQADSLRTLIETRTGLRLRLV